MVLNKIRNKIDEIDRQIVELLNLRYQQVKEVGNWKRRNNSPVYVPERERNLLRKICEYNQGPMTDDILKSVYREIMSGALKLESALRVTYFGPAGSFTHQAALSRFGHNVELYPAASIAAVFRDIEAERSDYGCVPIENSTEGAVTHTLDTLVNTNLSICAELNLPIHHYLMGREPFDKIKRVYSHIQVLGQCREYLQKNLPGVDCIETASTPAAAAVAAEEKGSAALAGKIAAELFELNILAENVEDFSNNTTRFLILGKQRTQATGDDKTSICFAVKDKVGALYDCLKPFKNHGITMTKVESRPMKNANWEYCFFIDIRGHRDNKNVQQAFAEIEQSCSFFKILGSYARTEN
ncbi:MAG: prephenate dehydratase [Victivallaceae bacterium]|nr:prephenate dehydratase [Victivallaceae bacterium]